MKPIYCFDENGYYAYETLAQESPLEPGTFLMPPNATDIAPTVTEGYKCKWNGYAWENEAIPEPEPAPEPEPPSALEIALAERTTAVANIKVTVDGKVFDGDEVAQARMARTVAIASATGAPMTTEVTWVLADNTVTSVTVAQLAQACLLAGQEQTRLWTVPYED